MAVRQVPFGSKLSKSIFPIIDCQVSSENDKAIEAHWELPEKCFKSIISRLDLVDRLMLECVHSSWRQSMYYDDVKCFRLADISSWSTDDSLSRWHYRSKINNSDRFLQSIDKEWSTLEGVTLNQILNCVLSRCKNLTSLTFSACDNDSCQETNDQVKIVLTSDTVRLIKLLSSHIQNLDISHCIVTDDALLKLLKKNKRNLLELNLHQCILAPSGQLSRCHLEKSFDDSLRKMRRLRRLNPCVFDFDALRLPETGLQSFRILELTNQTLLADEQLTRLWSEGDRSNLYNLQTLILSDNNFLTRFDIVSHLQSLKRLVFQRLPKLGDEDLQQIFHWCKELTDVELIDCRRIRFRFRWPSTMKRVRIIDPSLFDSQTLMCLAAQCPKLKRFELRMKNLHANGPDANAYALFSKLCSKLKKVSIDVIAAPPTILFDFALHCRNLASFSCKQVPMESPMNAEKTESGTLNGKKLKLKSLHLSNVNIDFYPFIDFLDRCDQLNDFSLRKIGFNRKSKDDVFFEILTTLAKRCLLLRRLAIFDCSDASSKSIQSFQEARRHKLEENVCIKHLRFRYRNSAQKLVKPERDIMGDLENVGVDFSQECGVDYSDHKSTRCGSSFDTPAFC